MLGLSLMATSSLTLRSIRPLVTRARLNSAMMAENDQGVDYAVKKSEAEWKAELSDDEYRILRQKGTEYPGYPTAASSSLVSTFSTASLSALRHGRVQQVLSEGGPLCLCRVLNCLCS